MPRKTTLAVLAALVAAGCTFPGAGEPHQFNVQGVFKKYDVKDPAGDNIVNGGPNGFMVTWYPLPVEDDDHPYAVQAYVQRAPYVQLGLGFADYDFFPALTVQGDSTVVEIGGGYVHKDTGLGGSFSAEFETIDVEALGDLGLSDWNIRILIQTESSFQGYLGYRSTSKSFNFEENFLKLLDPESQVDAWWLEFGTHQVFSFPHNQSLEYAVGYEYGTYDLTGLPAYGVKARFNRTSTLLKYYPAKCFGIGIAFGLAFFDDDTGCAWISAST